MSTTEQEQPQSGAYTFSSKRKVLIGLVIVVSIALTWVGSTQTAQSTYTPDFNAPFFTVWLSTSATSLIVLPFLLSVCFRRGNTTFSEWSRTNTVILGSNGLTKTSLFSKVLPFTVVWLITNYSYLRALGFIAATDVTALFSSCNGFVYIFSLLMLKEPLTVVRVVSVLLASSGIALMAYADGFSAANVQGVLLSVLAAVGAALYKVSFKKVFGDPTMPQVALFLSLLGLLNMLLFWPVLEVLYYCDVEHINWAHIPWEMLLSSAAIGLLFNFLINFGVAFTFPLFISLGTVLGIPVNAAMDAWFRNKTFDGTKIGASCLIVGGFLLMLLPLNIIAKIRGRKYDGVRIQDDDDVQPLPT